VGQHQTDGSSPPDPTLPILDPIAEIDNVDRLTGRDHTLPTPPKPL
jgi:hypothetical protein